MYSLIFNIYNIGIQALADELSNTATGPIVGSMFALTSNQQSADGAIAAMAPILKQMFRGAGEGTFTDSDQAILLQMIPTRKDSPKARASKLRNIDAIVREKLRGHKAPEFKSQLNIEGKGKESDNTQVKPTSAVQIGRFTMEVED